MRKQTKIAAVVSAAALLALGASITSFAASRGTWMLVDGEWYCYDSHGDVYENTFCVSNGKDYYVGDDGMLVRSSWVEYDGDYYFVNSAGQKITNDWRLTTPYEDEDAEEQWFYFQASGKRAEDKKLTIKGKTYFFDADGQMLIGWVQENGDSYEEASSDIAGNEGDFSYCDESGARVENAWVWDYAPDVDADEADSDDYEHWYWMGSDGHPDTGKKNNIEGQTYLFGENGRMLTGWVATTDSNYSDKDAYVSIQKTVEDEDQFTDLKDIASYGGEVYYCTEDDGHVKKNKWIKLWNTEDAYDVDDDNTQYWFYIEKTGEVYVPSSNDADAITEAVKHKFEDGKIVENGNNPGIEVIKHRVNGKDYFFNRDGEMISNFILVEEASDDLKAGLYYLGGSDDGVMKTGSVSIADDTGESYRFYFGTKDSEGGKGVGYTGNKSGKLYYDGMLITANDYKYAVVEVTDSVCFIVNQSGSIQHSNTSYKEDGDTLIRTKFDADEGETEADNTVFYDKSDDGVEDWMDDGFVDESALLYLDPSLGVETARDMVYDY